jgi:hypothetical protein
VTDPQHYSPPSGYAPAPAKRGNPAGLVSLIAVGVLVALAIVEFVVQAGLVATSNYGALGLVGATFAILNGLFALLAVVFGIIGLSRSDRPRVLAALGLGAGGFALFMILIWSVLYPAVLGVVG